MMIKLLKEKDYITTTWSGGKTTEIYIYPESSNYKEFDFKFRISSATVELEQSEFTKLNGIYRFITPLDNELKLTHNHESYINLKPFEIYEFSGGIDTTSFGKVRDFNLMLGKGTNGELESILVDEEYYLNTIIPKVQCICFLYSYDKEICVDIREKGIKVEPNETLLIQLDKNEELEMRVSCNSRANILYGRVFLI